MGGKKILLSKVVMVWFFIFFSNFSLTFDIFAESTAFSFHFREAVEYALSHSPAMNSAKLEVNIVEMERKNAFSSFLPSLDLTARHGLQDSTPRIRENPWVSDFNLSFSENLYDNGETFTKYRISQMKKQQAEITFLKERDRVCLEVSNEFFRYILALKLYDIIQNQSELVKKQFEMVKKDFRQGLKTRKDFLRFKTQLNRTEIDLVNANLEALKSKEELIRLLGLTSDDSSQIHFLSEDESENENKDKVLSKIPTLAPKMEDHYEFRIAQIQNKIGGLESVLIKRKYWPEINLTTNLNYQSSDYIEGGDKSSFFEKDQVSWNALISISYNFWDWGVRSRNMKISYQRNAVSKNELDNKLLTVRSEMKRLMYDLTRFKENFKLSMELLALEKDNYNLLESEYRYGKVQYLDLITGLKDLADAKTKYYTALSDLKQGLLTFRYHEGTLYESIVSENIK